MTWTEFLASYTAAVLACLLLGRSLFAGAWSRVCRVLVFVTSVFFVANYIAEDRGFWHFSDTIGITVLGIPIENTIFTLTTAVLILLLYRGSERLFLLYKSHKETLT